MGAELAPGEGIATLAGGTGVLGVGANSKARTFPSHGADTSWIPQALYALPRGTEKHFPQLIKVLYVSILVKLKTK